MKKLDARLWTMVFGIWLFISAFLWTHSPPQFHNAWLVGLLSAGLAAVHTRVGFERFLNLMLATWLLLSAFLIPSVTAVTVWHNAAIAVAMLATSIAAISNITRGGRMELT